MSDPKTALTEVYGIPGPVYGRPPHEAGCSCFHCFVWERKENGKTEGEAVMEWQFKVAGMGDFRPE